MPKRLTQVVRPALLALAAGSFVGCAHDQPPAPPTVEVIAQGSHSGVTTPDSYWLDTSDDWSEAITLDVDKERLRAARAKGGRLWVLFAGQLPTGGYRVSAELREGDNGTPVVACVVQPPEEGISVTQALTAPWALVRVDSHGRLIHHKPCSDGE